MEEVNYHVHDRLLYHLGKLCIPQAERVHVIREAHSSLVSGHFGVGSFTRRFLFETCFGYLPKLRMEFIFSEESNEDGHEDGDKEINFIQTIQKIHEVVRDQLEKRQAKYKIRQDKHNMDHRF